MSDSNREDLILAKLRAFDQYPYPFVDIFVLNDTSSSYEYTTEDA
jgi:hypothetical protein